MTIGGLWQVPNEAASFQVEVVREDQLVHIRQQWEILSASASELNPFFEPWMLLPALKAIGDGKEVCFGLIWYRDPANAKAEPLLVGFFPFIRHSHLKGLPASALEVLTHIYCFIGVPLLHRKYSKSALGAFIDWLASPASGVTLVLFRSIPNDGAFHQSLVEILYSRSLISLIERRYTRGVYKTAADPQAYIIAQLSHKYRKQLLRKKEALTKEGRLEFRQLSAQDDVGYWTGAFLQLEASGWKGVTGTALASVESHAEFFRDVARAAHRMDRLSMSGLWLDGQMIAGRTGFRASDGLYLFKIAFDERYSKYSPGILLELECMCNGSEGIAWIDCCATANNLVFKRLWTDYRTMEDVIVSAGSFRSDCLLSVLPVLRFAKRRLAKIWRRVYGSGESVSERGRSKVEEGMSGESTERGLRVNDVEV
jgi:hypothetical protein